MTRLDFRKANFTRDASMDFTDDGSRFYGYVHRSGMPMTYCSYDGCAYISLRVDYLKDLAYDEYCKLLSYDLGDLYNGVPKERVDMAKLDEIATALMAEYKEATKDLKPVDNKAWVEYVRQAKEIAISKYSQMKKLVADNFEAVLEHCDKWEVERLLDSLRPLKNDISRKEKMLDITDERCKREHLREGLRSTISSAQEDYYCKTIRTLIKKITK